MTPRPSWRRTARAFTLLEVMVALALLAAALMALADLGGQALRNHAYARDLSAAVLLARGRMAELEERYEDSGFKSSDEDDQGDFSEAGRPDLRWRVEVIRPDPQLSAEKLVGMLAGSSDPADVSALLVKLGAGGGAAQGGGPASAGAGPAAALVTSLLQGQLTALAETLKKSFREMRLTVSWQDGKVPRHVTVTTHLFVLNPRAPGGARGDAPDLPASLAAGSILGAGAVPGAAPGANQPGPVPGIRTGAR